jgi:TP901 family phage tail tape measure protein
MSAFNVFAKFAAIDKFSAPVKAMGANVQSFAAKAETNISRADRAFNKLSPTLSNTSKELLSFASAAAITGGLVAGAHFSVKALQEYEASLASLSAITGVTGPAFEEFKFKINEVAKETKKSSVEVAKAFELVGSAKPELLADAGALGEVTKASIILSKATKEDLEVSAQSLAGTLNQFGLGAEHSIRVINALAAGSQAGAAAVPLITQSMDAFGTVASSMNVSVEESIALIETLAEKNLKGAEAGTKIRNVLTKMATIQALPKEATEQLKKHGVNLAFVADNSVSFKDRLAELSKIQNDATAMAKVFGTENLVGGQILLQNISKVEQYTNAVTGTNTANEQAEKNSNTLTGALEEAQKAWVNIVTGSSSATSALDTVKSSIQFLTNNMGTIVDVGSKVILMFALTKAAIIAGKVALTSYNSVWWVYRTAQAVNLALQGKSLLFLKGNTAAMVAYKSITALVTAKTWLWNLALSMNPIVAIALGIAAATLAVYGLVKAFQSSTAAERVNEEVRKRALESTIDQRVEVSMLFAALKKATVGSEEYGNILKKIDSIQPGIVEQYRLQAGAIEDINSAEKELIRTIMKRAEVEARAEILKEKTKELLQAQAEGPGMWDKVLAAMAGSAVSAEMLHGSKLMDIQKEIDLLSSQVAQDQMEAVNPKAAEQNAMVQKLESTNNAKVTLDVNDNNNRVKANTDNDFVRIKTSSTVAFGM